MWKGLVIFAAMFFFTLSLGVQSLMSGAPSVSQKILEESISTDREYYNVGEPVTVFFGGGPGYPKDWIGIYKEGDEPGVVWSTLWYYVDGTQISSVGITDGSVTFETGLAEEGNYWAGFFLDDGYTLLADIEFFVYDGQPRVSIDKMEYGTGDSITVSFKFGPGNATDWIGIYKRGDVPDTNPSTLWLYVNGATTASEGISEGNVIFPEGLSAAGAYWVGFFEKDGYTILDSLSFVVKESADINPESKVVLPEDLTLHNYPNPFNPVTQISYTNPQAGRVTISITDALGKEIAVLVDERKQPGRYLIPFNGSNLASGVYFCRITTESESLVKKMMLIK